jgi:hypothetical protein
VKIRSLAIRALRTEFSTLLEKAGSWLAVSHTSMSPVQYPASVSVVAISVGVGSQPSMEEQVVVQELETQRVLHSVVVIDSHSVDDSSGRSGSLGSPKPSAQYVSPAIMR